MNKEIIVNAMKFKDVGLGAKFIRVKEEHKYLYIKVNNGAINATKMIDGTAYLLSGDENIILVID